MENSQNTFKKGCVILTQPFLYPFTISQQAPQKHPASLSPQCLTTPPPHRLTASPPHRLTASPPPQCLTASPPPQCLTASPPPQCLTASPPHCRVAPWCDRATNPTVLTVPTPPHCHPARSADATLPTLPQCRVAPWCDRANNPTAPPSVTLVLLVLLDLFLSTLREISAVSAGFCVGEGRLAWGLVGCRVARSHQGATLHSGLGWG